eukprot:gnl/MRDRNA2_/MRDRNA2_59927_c0_seq1.p1 gnl/MRDRNA2_/MRDRNA2_59927_c0~~gnl/MRDRNA2_/MRDRNA2_59927_c0_seq1.p1  ORF type:complete len:279 (+),score=44.32 gnl/MRDRNA2_/MRDRNA2_59927_c0_seq1:86-922(+)
MISSLLVFAVTTGFAMAVNVDNICKADAACMNEDNLKQCKSLYEECGDRMFTMESCPLQFGCPSTEGPSSSSDSSTVSSLPSSASSGSSSNPDLTATSSSSSSSSSETDVCREDVPCMNAENAATCRQYWSECGDQMMIMESCPAQFACPGEATSASLSSSGAGTWSNLSSSSSTEICKEDGACMKADNAATCRKYQAECGNRMVVMTSCPPQFSCSNSASSSPDNSDALAIMASDGSQSSKGGSSNDYDQSATSSGSRLGSTVLQAFVAMQIAAVIG